MQKKRINILVIIGMMVAIGTVAFKATEKKSTNPLDGWYEISWIGTPSDAPSNQEISRQKMANPPPKVDPTTVHGPITALTVSPDLTFVDNESEVPETVL